MFSNICAVVGVGPGVSLAVARRFAREGFQIALLARRAEALAGYVTELAQQNITAQGFIADAGNEQSLVAAFEQVRTQMGHPDVLIYNAAVIRDGQPASLSTETLLSDFRVNVMGALVSVQQVLPEMRAQQAGTILLTGGGLALYPMPQYASLALGKAALRSFTYTLGGELEADTIQVATVTITGTVQPGTHFDPDLIAEAYWTLHRQPPGQREREIIYR